MLIKTVTVIGANGTMGQNIAGIFASFGNTKVYMISRNIQDAIKAKEKASKSVKAEIIANNLIPKTYEELEDCVMDSDLVFESVAENMEIKKSVYAKINDCIKPHTVIGTGTSGLSINGLSEVFNEDIRKRFMGIHMFNPPYNMILCEVIPSKNTDANMLNDTKNYLENVLNRKVVEVVDSPAFMGNRIGFQFINEALQYAEKFKENGGIDYIDSIIGPFTGRNMPPLTTADFVGLDVHKAIVDNVNDNTKDFAHDTFVMPSFALKLISENKLGRKAGCGLYQLVKDFEGKKTVKVYDILTESYREKKKYNFNFADKMISKLALGDYNKAANILLTDDTLEAKLCVQFLIKYVIYSVAMSKKIGESIHSADDVMATGFSWIPPLAVIDWFGGVDKFKELMKCKMDDDYLCRISIDDIFESVPQSNYDYRPFLKAK